VLQRSQNAPPEGWPRPEKAGFHDLDGWRLYAQRLPQGRTLIVGQTRSERTEARKEVIATAGGTALLVALLGHLWLRARVRRELRPLEALSDRIRRLNLDSSTQVSYMGPASRDELVSIHEALETLSARLANRMAKERAFSAHAAHALRTPLAGMDVQLAIAIRESPEPLRDRLVRIRQAARQLQYVVTALLGLFRSEAPARHVELEVEALVRSLPTPSLTVDVSPGLRLKADPDLMAAALVNLLDNAQRHGARKVDISAWHAGGLLIHDDGPGVSAERRQALLQALRADVDAGSIGLGLMLADSVARAHGGILTLPEVSEGFSVALEFGHEPAPTR
jgi:signal transduction histidine kinase